MFRRRAAAPKLKTEAQDSKARSWLHDRPGSFISVALASMKLDTNFICDTQSKFACAAPALLPCFLRRKSEKSYGKKSSDYQGRACGQWRCDDVRLSPQHGGAGTDVLDLGCSEPQSSAGTYARRGLRDHGRIPHMGRTRPRTFPPAHRLCYRFWGDTCDDNGGGRLVHAGNGGPSRLPRGRHRHLHRARDVSAHAPPALLSFRKRSNNVNRDGRAARFCARLVIVALAGAIILELMHAIEGPSPGFRPADWICRGAV